MVCPLYYFVKAHVMSCHSEPERSGGEESRYLHSRASDGSCWRSISIRFVRFVRACMTVL